MINILYIIAYFLSIFGLISIAYMAYNSDRSKLNRSFALLSSSLALWLLLQLAAQVVASNHKVALQLLNYSVCTDFLIAYFAIDFVRNFRGSNNEVSRWLLIVPVLFYAVGWASNSIITDADISISGIFLREVGGLYWLILGVSGAIFLYVFYGFVKVYLAARHTDPAVRRRTALLIIGTLQLALVGFGLSSIVALAGFLQIVIPLSALLMAILIAYAIVQHGLFNIRLVVARSMGYVFTLAAVVAVYGFIIFGLARYVLRLELSATAQISMSLITGIVTLSFGRIKRVFDRLSNRLFYQDAYDAQDLYDHLNQILVSTLDTTKLLQQTSRLLQSSFKSEFVVARLKESEQRDGSTTTAANEQMFDDAIPVARKLTSRHHKRVIVGDFLEQGETQLKQFMGSHNIAVLVRIISDVDKEKEGLGYIALGPKKSGSPYTAEDARVLDAIANELVVAVQNALHFEEIQNFNKTLQERINRATKELRRTNDKLKQLDETKDEFITMASHQLRTPLTSVKGYLSMVLEGDVGKVTSSQRKLLEQSYSSSQRMVYLISDLLNLSRLNTGKFVIEPSPVDLSEVVEAEYQQLIETAKSREVKLTYHKPHTFPELMLDETKIHQVVMNLMDNAIYYTRAGGSVTVELKETPTAVEYTVKDTGIGVPKAVQHKLFSKFYRASNAQQARPDGTGLGLFMVRKVIAAQGGSIIFESQEGKGSTFGFRFNKADHLPPTTMASTTAVPVKAVPATPEPAAAAK